MNKIRAFLPQDPCRFWSSGVKNKRRHWKKNAPSGWGPHQLIRLWSTAGYRSYRDMEVTTLLTWIEEKMLERLLGNASLTLLYESSVHKLVEMSNKCSLQGSTMTVFHLKQDIIVGVFMLEDFPSLDSEKLCTCAWFSLKKNNSSEIRALFLNTQVTVNSTGLHMISPGSLTLTVDFRFGCTLYLNDEAIEELELNPKYDSRCWQCEIFRVDGIKKNPGFIKKMVTAKQHREKLLSALKAYRPYEHLVSEVHILLVGPVGSGKSSFINSVKSAFQGHLTRQAIVGSDESSITKQYRVYSIKDGKSGETLPFMLCDSMGLEEGEEAGLCMDDIPHILKGCVPDRYQFNPCKPIKPKHFTSAVSPPLKDRIHCVAFVLDISSVNTLSDKMLGKLKKIHKDVVDCGVGHVALLTNVKNYDEVLDDNFVNMAESVTSLSQVQNVQKMLNIPIANILMVSNYASERRLEPMKDILIFAALGQMLRAADDALEDLPLEDAGNLDPF